VVSGSSFSFHSPVLFTIFNYLYIYVMTTITLEFPDSLGEYQNDTVRFIAAKLYESGKLSLGQAAAMVGLSKRTFANY
jgi:predicted HTH domain antitoxin